MGKNKVSKLDVPLKEHLEKLFSSRIDVIDTKLNSAERALSIQSEVNERRLEGLNELRKDVTTDRDLFLKKEVYDITISLITKKLDEHSTAITQLESKQVKWFAVIGVALVVLNLVLKYGL